MINIVEECGRNAGRIWETLRSQGPLSETKLMRLTKLKEHEFYAAVGWLARENKICKDGDTFKLGETNLTNKIGVAAGKVYTAFETSNEVDVSEIPQMTDLEPKDVHAALGWLARENKIEAMVPIPKEYNIKFK
jgi:predicted NUDIX family NTP pyrophosphohydrolase